MYNMTQRKIIAVLGALLDATEKGAVEWEDTPCENVFRAWVGDENIKIKEMREPGLDDSHPGDVYFVAWVVNAMDEIVDKIELWPGQEGYVPAESLFSLARRHVRKADQVMDRILTTLKSQ